MQAGAVAIAVTNGVGAVEAGDVVGPALAAVAEEEVLVVALLPCCHLGLTPPSPVFAVLLYCRQGRFISMFIRNGVCFVTCILSCEEIGDTVAVQHHRL